MKKFTLGAFICMLLTSVFVTAQISSFPYQESFEAGDGGWVASGTNSTWALGTPAKTVINGASDGIQAWVTNLTGAYNVNENSQVLSPEFDFSGLANDPRVIVDIWWESEFSWDGANLQSSIDGGGSWQNVGANGDPDNWYNDNTISGSPGGSQVGWTGRNGSGSGGYVVAQHELTGLAGESSVFFRVNFGSDSSVTDDGFAFDNFRIAAGDPPVIVCPMDIVADNAPGMCSAVANFAAAAIDPEDGDLSGSVTYSQNPGTSFPVGTTAVTATVTDSDGNVSSCTFNVTVNDVEDPTIACMDITVELDAMGGYTLLPSEVVMSSADNCAIASTDILVPGVNNVASPVTPFLFNGTGIIDTDVTIPNPGMSDLDVTITVDFTGDFDFAGTETLALNGPDGALAFSQNGNGGAGDCIATTSFTVAQATWNGWITTFGPDITFTALEDADVDNICVASELQLTAAVTGLAPVASFDFDCSSVGANDVIVQVTDPSGNTAQCTAVVTVEDNIAPVIACIGEPAGFTVTEDFEGATIPAGWTTNILAGPDDWEFGSGDLPTGDDFPTNAAIFNDDAAGNGTVNAVNLLSPVYDTAGALDATLGFEVAFQEFGDQEFAVEVWDGAAWQQVAFYDADLDPDIQTESIDVVAFANANFQVRFAYDDLGGWGWHAAIDNFSLVYNLPPGTPLEVDLDANGMASILASDLLIAVDEACGWTATVATDPGVVGLSTLFASNNGGAQGGVVYFDVTVGPADINLSGFEVNTADPDAFSMEIYAITGGTYVGNEADPAPWTLIGTASGTASGTEDVPSPATIDGGAITLTASTTYAMALVMDATHAHEYTNGDGSNQSFSNADLTIDLGSASNTPFAGPTFNPRVWNGTLVYESIVPGASTVLDLDCSNLGSNEIEVTVTDDSGNVSTCIATVNVNDVTDPILVCQDITVSLDENGMAEIEPEDLLANTPDIFNILVIGSDNGSGAVGTTDFTVNITDAATVEFDWLYSTTDAPGFDSFGYLLNGVYTELADTDGQSGSESIAVAPGDVFGFRSDTDDNGFGNNEIIISNFMPGFEGQFAQANWTLALDNSDGSAEFILAIPGGPLSFDACGITILAVDIDEFTCDDIGTPIVVTVFASDASGNLASCTSTVTVVDDMGPEITCPADQTVDPGPTNLQYEVPDYWANGEATAVDNCTDPLTIFTQDPAAGTLLEDGTYVVTLTAEDEYGNVSTCTFELIVESILGQEDNPLANGIAIYPNPADAQVILANNSGIQLERAQIFDVNARLVMNLNLNNMGTERTIDVSQLATGAYLVQLEGEGQTATKRLIKR